MEEYPIENYERQIRYEMARDICFHDSPVICTGCGNETVSTYSGECLNCTRRWQWMAEDCWKTAQKSHDLKYNEIAMAKGKDKQKKQPQAPKDAGKKSPNSTPNTKKKK